MEKISWNRVKTQKLAENITRKMFWGENIMVTKWELGPDAQIPPHEHINEQVTMVQRGMATLYFPDGEEVSLSSGDMLVIPPSKPHGVRIGPDGCTVVDVFSPIREDFIQNSSAYLAQAGLSVAEEPAVDEARSQEDPYERLNSFLVSVGIDVPIEKLRETPLETLARYCYEKECITMGQLRSILGLDKTQAKELLRAWKHGDDHSESSYRRKLERMIVLPAQIKVYGPK